MVRQQGNPTGTVTIPERRKLSDEERRQVTDRFWEVIERISERNRDLDPEVEFAFITEVVEEVRQELYEREQAKEPVADNVRGEPVAVVPDPETDEEVKSQDRLRESFWRVAQRIGERNRDKDPNEVLAIVTEVVEEVHQEQYEREQREAANRR